MSNVPILELCNEWVKIMYRTKIDDAYRIRVSDGSTHCVNNENVNLVDRKYVQI